MPVYFAIYPSPAVSRSLHVFSSHHPGFLQEYQSDFQYLPCPPDKELRIPAVKLLPLFYELCKAGLVVLVDLKAGASTSKNHVLVQV